MKKKKEGKKNLKTCLECSQKINLDLNKFVLLQTIDKETSLKEDAYFHFSCWVDYFNKRVENKARINVEAMQKQAMTLFDHPMIKNALEQIRGSDVALNMLKMPLNSPNSYLKNGTKKRSGKKAK